MAKFASYRLPLSIGAALALSLAVPAFAQDVPKAETPHESEEWIMVSGSVRESGAAQEAEDLSLPELPVAPDTGR